MPWSALFQLVVISFLRKKKIIIREFWNFDIKGVCIAYFIKRCKDPTLKRKKGLAHSNSGPASCPNRHIRHSILNFSITAPRV